MFELLLFVSSSASPAALCSPLVWIQQGWTPPSSQAGTPWTPETQGTCPWTPWTWPSMPWENFPSVAEDRTLRVGGSRMNRMALWGSLLWCKVALDQLSELRASCRLLTQCSAISISSLQCNGGIMVVRFAKSLNAYILLIFEGFEWFLYLCQLHMPYLGSLFCHTPARTVCSLFNNYMSW